ncbi:MtnX-like HAD-IB family phosphatase [Bacillus carboniphilus]|uniref:MtnX-like HAD-IB family phosphatase n=1 Tax=Bacillus carboniphilus TaxID=86663 RepID=A0ABY9JVF1_9BACI|nr:MtnX-like HAD-IB family phosphatase [Bacillus carboniphilus]WLR43389.1 MtnX-like HAD-IB family phosphatase [Bacillus carboniphilus]
MKKWAFVSDFDGTISKKDFYWVVIEKYFPEGKELFHEWKDGKLQDIDFLTTVFRSIGQEEEQIIEDILQIPIDEKVPAFVREVQKHGGDFYILSAGTDYYIHHILKKYNLENVKVFSNEGYYDAKNIHMKIDKNHEFYSPRYGIDKSKVISMLKKDYQQVFFAGDSEPDSHPAKVADVTFAKDALQTILQEQEVNYVPVSSFENIQDHLQKQGWLSV